MVHASGLADPRPSCCAKGLTLDELLRASATLDQQKPTGSPEWQVAFLGETEPRAARPGRDAGEQCK